MTRPRIGAIAVGIPARDEATTITSTLRSVARAAARCDVPVSIVVAADSCADDTAGRATAFLSTTTSFSAHAVAEVGCSSAGAARDAACRIAIATLDLPSDRIWLATTDADSTVPRDWLGRHLAWAALGADGVAGQVRVDRSAPALIRLRAGRHLDRLGSGHGHPHVHGANLGVRADRWERVGGFPHLAVGEDQALWQVLAGDGADLVAAPDGIVTTSGRLVGRAPGGFAAVLAGLAG